MVRPSFLWRMDKISDTSTSSSANAPAEVNDPTEPCDHDELIVPNSRPTRLRPAWKSRILWSFDGQVSAPGFVSTTIPRWKLPLNFDDGPTPL